MEFIAVNTDAQVLETSKASTKLQIGEKLTKGLGAGGHPSIGEQAALESKEDIIECIKGAEMVFVTAGMGGGTGTGAAPIVASCAKEMGILVVGVVTKPFKFEGAKRMRQAESGINRLREVVDTVVIIPNEKLRDISNKNTTLVDSFKMADVSLTNGVEGLADMILSTGIINLDFADIETVMRNSGSALMGVGVASGENAIEQAVVSALNSPFLEKAVNNATGALVCLYGEESTLTLQEIYSAGDFIKNSIVPEAHFIFGASIDSELGPDTVRATVIMTGFTEEDSALLEILDADSKSKVKEPAKAVENKETVPQESQTETAAVEDDAQVAAKPVDGDEVKVGSPLFRKPKPVEVGTSKINIPDWMNRNKK